MAAHKAALAKAGSRVDLGDTLKLLRRAHAAVDWDLFESVGLDTADDAAQREADLDAERAGPIKTLLKLAGEARGEAQSLIASFKVEAALKKEALRLAGDLAAAAATFARSVDDAVASAGKAVKKRRLTLAATSKPAQAPAVDPKLTKLAAIVRARLIAGLKAVRIPRPGQPPMKFIAGVAAARARVVIGATVGNAQQSQLLALLPDEDGIKWMKGDCVWEDKAVTFVCINPAPGVGKRLQRGLLEQTQAKLRVRVRKLDGNAELCDGSDDPAALQATDGEEAEGAAVGVAAAAAAAVAVAAAAAAAATSADLAELKTRRLVFESRLRVFIGALLPGISQLSDAAQRRDHAARVVKLRQAVTKLGGLTDAVAVTAIEAMLAKVIEQQAQLEPARQPKVAGQPVKALGKPAKQEPRPRDLADPRFAKEVLALLTPQERANLKTQADYEWAVANYHTVMASRNKLGPMPGRLELTPPTLDIRTPEIGEAQAQDRAQFYADRKVLRGVYAARGLDPSEVDGFDEQKVAAQMWQLEEAERLAANTLANDGRGDSKGPVNHLLDGVEHGLFKVGHDIGNIGLAGKFTYDAVTGKAQLEEPAWFGAAWRSRGQNQSYVGLAWELAGNIPIIGKAQLLYGATELVRGAWKGDWNNAAYGLGNIGGSLMFGGLVARAPLAPGKFADTRMGRAYEGGKRYLFGQTPATPRPRIHPAHLQPNDDGMHMPSEVHHMPADAHLVSNTPRGLRVEVAPHLSGTGEQVQPDLANRMHLAAKAVEGLLPPGRNIATPEGKPLAIVFDPAQPVPYLDRASGTVHMNPARDAQGAFPAKGPGAALARWAPKHGEPTPSEMVMQHELGHAAMPEIGARIGAISKRKVTRAAMKKFGLTNTPAERLTDARLAREEMLVHGLDELGADTIGVAAAKDLQAMPKSIAQGLAQALDAHAKNPGRPLPDEFPKHPVEWMRRRDFSDGGTIPGANEAVTPYDVFSAVRRHLGQHYGDALTGKNAPKVVAALMASNERFMQKLDAEPGLLDGDYVAANVLFVALFDAEAAKLGLLAKTPAARAPRAASLR